MRRRRGPGDDEKDVDGEPGHREIRLDAAVRVEQLRVDQPAERDVDVIGAEALEHREGVGPLQPELAERGLVEEPDRLADRAVLPPQRPSGRPPPTIHSATARPAPAPEAMPIELKPAAT